MQLGARDRRRHRRRQLTERALVEAVAVAMRQQDCGGGWETVGREAERFGLADDEAGMEPGVDEEPRPVEVEDDRPVRDARDREVGVRGVVRRAAGDRERGAAREQRDESEREPHYTLPCWRSAS